MARLWNAKHFHERSLILTDVCDINATRRECCKRDGRRLTTWSATACTASAAPRARLSIYVYVVAVVTEPKDGSIAPFCPQSFSANSRNGF